MTNRYMHKICMLFTVLILALYGSVSFAYVQNPSLIIDAKNKNTLPNNFRTTQKSLVNSQGVSTVGLADLNIAGSAQFSQQQLVNATQELKKPIIIVDLRQESHGFIDGNAVSWYGFKNWANVDKTDQQAAQDEAFHLAQLKQQQGKSIILFVKKKIIEPKPISMTINSVQSEAELVKENHLGYQRFYVTDRRGPTDQVVDQFISFVKQLPPGTTLYFHCRQGKGRTTTFMTMYDMMRNAKTVSLQNIIERQELLGGVNLLSSNMSGFYSEQRTQFIKQFYNYCRTNQDNFSTNWQEWLKQTHD